MGKRSDKRKKRKRRLQQQNIRQKGPNIQKELSENGKNVQPETPYAVNQWTHKFFDFLCDWSRVIIGILYLLVWTSSFLDQNKMLKSLMACFMGLVAIGFSIFYSDWFYALILENIYKRPIFKALEKSKLLPLIVSILLAAITFVFIILIFPGISYIYTNNDLGNILTWVSMILFFVNDNSEKVITFFKKHHV